MRIEYNFNEYRSLIQRLERFTDGGMEQFIIDFLNDLADKTIDSIKIRTPVDTGLLQSSWQRGPVTRQDGYYQVEIFNLVEYSGFVEFGHLTSNRARWIAGRFMMTVTMRELERDLPQYLETALAKQLNNVMSG